VAFFKSKGKFKVKGKGGKNKKAPPKKNQCRFCRRGLKLLGKGAPAGAAPAATAAPAAPAAPAATAAPAAPAAPTVPAAPAAPIAPGALAAPAAGLPPKAPQIVDYKDVRTLQKLCTSQGKLFSRKRSGNCAKHQRQFRRAAKRARFLALLPYVGR